jgi:hypothetical protein
VAGADTVTELDVIREEAERREISRLAHFTPLRNLVHIAAGKGLSSTKQMLVAERAEFNQQDLQRLDGYPDHICCSIEYPNAYYLRQKRRGARGEDRIFPDWVCLLIDPHHLWQETTRFCRHNAAGALGANVKGGADCFATLFADEVEAPRDTWKRGNQPDCCPTDMQAEVLVHRHIPLSDVQAIAVQSEDQAGDVYARLRQLGAPVDELPLIVAADFYRPYELAATLRSGQRPVESSWHSHGHGARADASHV